jgi:hypothetical protein
LPAFPFIAILIAHCFDQVIVSQRLRPLTIGFAVLMSAFGGGYMIVPFALSKLRDCPQGLHEVVSSILATMCAVSLLALVGMLRRKPYAALALFVASTLSCECYFGARALDVLSDNWEGPLQSFGQYAAVSNWPIVVFDMRKPTVDFYTHRHSIIPPDREALQHDLRLLNTAYILTPTKNLQLLQQLGCKTVRTEGKIALIAWRNPAKVGGDHSAEIISTTANLDQ